MTLIEKLIGETFIFLAMLFFACGSYSYSVDSKFAMAWLCTGILSCTIHIIVKIKS